MDIRFNITGERRKALVAAVSKLTGWDAVYMKAPTFAYAVNNYVIDKNGVLSFDERQNIEDARSLLAGLSERGFVSEDGTSLRKDSSPTVEFVDLSDRLTIEMSLSGFTDTALHNLELMVESKAELICKSLGTDALPIERAEDRLLFPWFSVDASSDQFFVYTQFVEALCEMAKTQKRVTAKAKPVDSEKYTFRCFLLRLGFIGSEYALSRKLLLANLSGSSSFKSNNRSKGVQDKTRTVEAGNAEVSLYE